VPKKVNFEPQLDEGGNLTPTPTPPTEQQPLLEADEKSIEATPLIQNKSSKPASLEPIPSISIGFLNKAATEDSFFPINQEPAVCDVAEKPNILKEEKANPNSLIILYLAEIIHIQCHHKIKCSKFKIGHLVRDRMSSAHKSRITHLDPFANFYW
jgi:hypothetical protein